MIIHVLSNPISVVRFDGDCNDKVIVNSKFIGEIFENKHCFKPIVASRYKAFFIYLYFMLQSKLSSKIRFHIYHEGNNYFFDLLWLVLSPKVDRTEYYNLYTLQQVPNSYLKNSIYYRVLKYLKLQNHFDYFRSIDDFGRPDIIWFRVKDEFVEKSFKPFPLTINSKRPKLLKSAIILIGKDVAADSLLSKIIDDVIECLGSVGILTALKNHPNPAFHLSYESQGDVGELVKRIDPLIPAEDYADMYNFALGFGSTGILSFKTPISLYKLLPKSSGADERVRYLQNMAKNTETNVFFPTSIEDLEKYLCS